MFISHVASGLFMSNGIMRHFWICFVWQFSLLVVVCTGSDDGRPVPDPDIKPFLEVSVDDIESEVARRTTGASHADLMRSHRAGDVSLVESSTHRSSDAGFLDSLPEPSPEIVQIQKDIERSYETVVDLQKETTKQIPHADYVEAMRRNALRMALLEKRGKAQRPARKRRSQTSRFIEYIARKNISPTSFIEQFPTSRFSKILLRDKHLFSDSQRTRLTSLLEITASGVNAAEPTLDEINASISNALNSRAREPDQADLALDEMENEFRNLEEHTADFTLFDEVGETKPSAMLSFAQVSNEEQQAKQDPLHEKSVSQKTTALLLEKKFEETMKRQTHTRVFEVESEGLSLLEDSNLVSDRSTTLLNRCESEVQKFNIRFILRFRFIVTLLLYSS